MLNIQLGRGSIAGCKLGELLMAAPARPELDFWKYNLVLLNQDTVGSVDVQHQQKCCQVLSQKKKKKKKGPTVHQFLQVQ